jgi:hypothetical protein
MTSPADEYYLPVSAPSRVMEAHWELEMKRREEILDNMPLVHRFGPIPVDILVEEVMFNEDTFGYSAYGPAPFKQSLKVIMSNAKKIVERAKNKAKAQANKKY